MLFVVLVRVTEQKFSERGDVAVIELRRGHIAPPFPIDLRLADAVRETEWLDAIEIGGLQPANFFEGIIPFRAFRVLQSSRAFPARRKTSRPDAARLVLVAPFPFFRCVGIGIAEPTRATLLRHAAKKFRRETCDDRICHAKTR